MSTLLFRERLTIDDGNIEHDHGEMRTISASGIEWKIELDIKLVIDKNDSENLKEEIEDIISRYAL